MKCGPGSSLDAIESIIVVMMENGSSVAASGGSNKGRRPLERDPDVRVTVAAFSFA
jgi:hypothetical protein